MSLTSDRHEPSLIPLLPSYNPEQSVSQLLLILCDHFVGIYSRGKREFWNTALMVCYFR